MPAMRTVQLAALLAVASITAPCDARLLMAAPAPVSLASYLSGQPDLSIASSAFESSGVTGMVDGSKAGYSVFAPRDEAWDALAEAYNVTLSDLLASPLLRGIVEYQVSTQATDSLTSGATLGTLFSQPIQVAGNSSAGSLSTQSAELATLMGQTDVASVVAAPIMVNGNTWVYETAAVLVPTAISQALQEGPQ